MASGVATAMPSLSSPRSDPNRHDPIATILISVADGDREAFEELYRRTSAKLFGICLGLMLNRSEAEDALQEVYCSVWRRASTFDHQRGRGMVWLITLARNRSIDQLRRLKLGTSVSIEDADGIADAGPLPEEIAAVRVEERRMQSFIGILDERDAAALRSAFFDGLTYTALARDACVPLATMKSRMRRSLRLLRGAMAWTTHPDPQNQGAVHDALGLF